MSSFLVTLDIEKTIRVAKTTRIKAPDAAAYEDGRVLWIATMPLCCVPTHSSKCI